MSKEREPTDKELKGIQDEYEKELKKAEDNSPHGAVSLENRAYLDSIEYLIKKGPIKPKW
jgi:hypothetical protein